MHDPAQWWSGVNHTGLTTMAGSLLVAGRGAAEIVGTESVQLLFAECRGIALVTAS